MEQDIRDRLTTGTGSYPFHARIMDMDWSGSLLGLFCSCQRNALLLLIRPEMDVEH